MYKDRPGWQRNGMLCLGVSLLYTALAPLAYKYFAHGVIKALYEGKLGSRLAFTGRSFLPLEHYFQQSDALFWGYIWLMPICTVFFWLLVYYVFSLIFARIDRDAPGVTTDSGLIWRADKLWACAAYAVCVAVFYIKYLPDLSTMIIGPARDNNSYVWTLWWGYQAVTNPAASFSFSNMIFYPEGGSLLYQQYSWYNLFLSFLLQPFLGLALVYNLLMLHSYILAGLGAFLLIRYITKNSLAAAVGGFVYAFNPNHVSHSTQCVAISAIQFFPFFLLYYIKSLREATWRATAAAAVFFLLTALCEWTYLIYCGFFMLSAYAYLAMARRRIILKDVIFKSLVIAGLTLLVVSPWVLKMMIAAVGHPEVYRGGHFDFVVDMLAPIVPSVHQWQFKAFPGFLGRVGTMFTGTSYECASYFGLINIGLIVYAFRNALAASAKYILGLLASLLLAFGPLPHILGVTIPAALPTLLYVKMPFLANARDPVRYVLFVYLFLAIIVGISLDHLMRRGHKKLVYLLAALIFLDFLTIPDQKTPLELPPVYAQIQADHDNFGVLDLPGGAPSNKYRYMVYSIFHGHPVVHSYIPRKLGSTLEDRLVLNDLAAQKQQLIDAKVKYIVIHKELMAENDPKRHVESQIRNLQDYPRYYHQLFSDDSQVLFKVY